MSERSGSMSVKTDTQVIINGKMYTLMGYESEEYIQKVASYVNGKISEFNKMEGFYRQPLDMQSVLLQLNIADDYFKAKKQAEALEEELQAKEKEVYDLKHELVSTQMKLEAAEKKAENFGGTSDGNSNSGSNHYNRSNRSNNRR